LRINNPPTFVVILRMKTGQQVEVAGHFADYTTACSAARWWASIDNNVTAYAVVERGHKPNGCFRIYRGA
jgi:hypothetical protein